MASRPQRGTGYIGLEQWLGQNRSQAAGMANSLADGIDAQGRKATGMLNYSVEDFENAADNAALNFDGDGFYDENGAPLISGASLAQQRSAAADAALEAGWKGPDSLDKFESYVSGRKLATEAQRDAGLSSDFYGRQALLQEKAGKTGGYALGQQRLDSALVGAAGGDRLDSTKSQWGSLLGKFDSAAANAKSYSERVQQNNKDTAARYRSEAEKLKANAVKAREATKADSRKQQEEAEGFDAQARIDQREADRAAVDAGVIPEGRKGGGLRVDEWAAKKKPKGTGSGRKTGWPTPGDESTKSFV